MPISDETLERFLGDWGDAAKSQADSMARIADKCDEAADKERERGHRIQLTLIALLTAVLAAVGLAKTAGLV